MSEWSRETEADEGLDMSQQMMDSLLLGVETQLQNEEYLMGISCRLQAALERMLMAITETNNQVGTKWGQLNFWGSVHTLSFNFPLPVTALTRLVNTLVISLSYLIFHLLLAFPQKMSNITR